MKLIICERYKLCKQLICRFKYPTRYSHLDSIIKLFFRDKVCFGCDNGDRCGYLIIYKKDKK